MARSSKHSSACNKNLRRQGPLCRSRQKFIPAIKTGSARPCRMGKATANKTAPFWKKSQAAGDPYTRRVFRFARSSLLPNRTCIIEYPYHAVPIRDGPMDHPVSAQWIDIVLIPPAQRGVVAQHEALKQRRPPVNQAPHKCDFNELMVVNQEISHVYARAGCRPGPNREIWWPRAGCSLHPAPG